MGCGGDLSLAEHVVILFHSSQGKIKGDSDIEEWEVGYWLEQENAASFLTGFSGL